MPFLFPSCCAYRPSTPSFIWKLFSRCFKPTCAFVYLLAYVGLSKSFKELLFANPWETTLYFTWMAFIPQLFIKHLQSLLFRYPSVRDLRRHFFLLNAQYMDIIKLPSSLMRKYGLLDLPQGCHKTYILEASNHFPCQRGFSLPRFSRCPHTSPHLRYDQRILGIEIPWLASSESNQLPDSANNSVRIAVHLIVPKLVSFVMSIPARSLYVIS